MSIELPECNTEVPGYYLVSNFGPFDKDTRRARSIESVLNYGAKRFNFPIEDFIVLENINRAAFALYIKNEHKQHIEAWKESIMNMLDILKRNLP